MAKENSLLNQNLNNKINACTSPSTPSTHTKLAGNGFCVNPVACGGSLEACNNSITSKKTLTRRSLLKRTVQAGATLALTGMAGLFANGCNGAQNGASGGNLRTSAGDSRTDAGNSGTNEGEGTGSANATRTRSVTGSNTEIVIAMPTTSEPDAGFDPFVSWGCGEHVHEPLIQSTLIKTTADMAFENDLATSYICSSDGLTWTFEVRDDARFTNGKQVSAHDVAYTINGIKASQTSECDLTYVENACALSDTTCEIKLTKPFNALLYTLAVIGIVPDGGHGENYGKNPVGSGRYMLEQWDAGQQAILRANPDYYGDAPKIERVVVVFMEESSALAAVQSASVDVAYTSATFAEQKVRGYDLRAFDSVDSRGVSLPCGGVNNNTATGETGVAGGEGASVAPTTSGESVATSESVTATSATASTSSNNTREFRGKTYACGNTVTSDLCVRQAINLGIDREQMIEHTLAGHGKVAYSVCDGMPWDSDDMCCETDVQAAKQLLDAGGWSVGADGVREKNGMRASIDLYYAASDSLRQAMAADFANQMREIGIEVNTKGRSWDEIYERQFADPVLWGWGTNSPIEAYNIMYSNGVCNYAGYANAAVDAHLNDALAHTNVADSYNDYKLAAWDGSAGVAPKIAGRENQGASAAEGAARIEETAGAAEGTAEDANRSASVGATNATATEGAATWVWFANVDHLYFMADGLNVAKQKPHPHGHGWSLLNNIDEWHW